LRSTLRRPHLWIIILLFVLCIVLHYPGQLPFTGKLGRFSLLGLERHALERILFLVPSIYAAYIFGLTGGCISLAVALAAMIPRILFISAYPRDAVFETALTVIIGVLVNAWMESRRREIGKREQTILKLETVRRELQRISRQFQDIFEKAHDAIWIEDLKGRIVTANDACSEVTGYQREAMTGLATSLLFPPEAGRRAAEVARELLAGRAAGRAVKQPYELAIIKRDGSRAEIMITTSVIGEGRTRALLHIARDLSEERKLQQSLRIYAEQIGRAHEEERKRIARELHDDTIQTLVVLSRRLDAVASGPTNARSLASLEPIRNEIDECLVRIRRFIQYLRPPILEYLGLTPALRELAEQVQRETGIRTSVDADRDTYRLDFEQQLLVYRIVQEALRNVWKHSRAERCSVRLRGGQPRLCITVEDDGEGFDSPDPSDLLACGKLGLMGMRERAHLLGGTLEIRSRAGSGTTVVISLADTDGSGKEEGI